MKPTHIIKKTTAEAADAGEHGTCHKCLTRRCGNTELNASSDRTREENSDRQGDKGRSWSSLGFFGFGFFYGGGKCSRRKYIPIANLAGG